MIYYNALCNTQYHAPHNSPHNAPHNAPRNAPRYVPLQKSSGYSLSGYIHSVGINDKRKAGYVGYNQMMWDFGLPKGQFGNASAVREIVSWGSAASYFLSYSIG